MKQIINSEVSTLCVITTAADAAWSTIVDATADAAALGGYGANWIWIILIIIILFGFGGWC